MYSPLYALPLSQHANNLVFSAQVPTPAIIDRCKMRSFLLITIFLTTLSPLFSLETNNDWEIAAQQRIREHRMGDAIITLRLKSGEPANGASVVWQQTAHDFKFGTAVNASYFAGLSEEDPYKQHIKELFNCAVLENAHKWTNWERSDRRQAANDCAAWLQKQNIALRGHTLVWQTKQFGKPMPKDVWNEVVKAEAGEEANLEHIRQRIADHIADQARKLSPQIFAWDVTNEISDHPYVLRVLDPDHKKAQTSSIIADWYHLAHKAAPNAELFVNDYDILASIREDQRAMYESTIQSLIDAKAPLHGIGMQCHVQNDSKWVSVADMNKTFDRFGKFGLPIWVTEFDMFGKYWRSEAGIANQGQCFKEFFISSFAHPSVEGFVFWGFWDGRHWFKNGTFFHKDWSPKPALAIYKDLVFNQWHSKANLQSDENGHIHFRAFKGTHRLDITHAGQSYSIEIGVHDKSTTQTIYLRD